MSRLEEIAARAEAVRSHLLVMQTHGDSDDLTKCERSAADIPWLLAECRRLEAERQRLREWAKTQLDGLTRSSSTEAGGGAFRAFVAVLAKMDELGPGSPVKGDGGGRG